MQNCFHHKVFFLIDPIYWKQPSLWRKNSFQTIKRNDCRADNKWKKQNEYESFHCTHRTNSGSLDEWANSVRLQSIVVSNPSSIQMDTEDRFSTPRNYSLMLPHTHWSFWAKCGWSKSIHQSDGIRSDETEKFKSSEAFVAAERSMIEGENSNEYQSSCLNQQYGYSEMARSQMLLWSRCNYKWPVRIPLKIDTAMSFSRRFTI